MASNPASFEIGKVYHVPCVRTQKHFWGGAGWIPVIGPKHEDAEFINFPHQHWHIDWRFAPEALLKRARRIHLAGSEYARTLMERGLWPFEDGSVQIALEGPTAKRKLCKRQFGPYPTQRARWIPGLEKAYKDCTLKPGMVCPHRGIPLAGAERDGDIVTCPGHGLRWNVITGALAPIPPATNRLPEGK